MAEFRESKVQRDLEELRAEHAKKLADLSVDEKLRLLQEEAKTAREELGLKLPSAERTKDAA